MRRLHRALFPKRGTHIGILSLEYMVFANKRKYNKNETPVRGISEKKNGDFSLSKTLPLENVTLFGAE